MPRTEPGFEPVVSRRRVLTGGVALAVLGMAVPACSSPPPAPPAVDELESQLTLARRRQRAGRGGAPRPQPQPVSAALTEVAAERTRHAQALTTEIARLRRQPDINLRETTSPTTTTSAAAAPPPPLADVVRSLRASAASASSAGEHIFGLSSRAARLHRRRVHGVLHRRAGVRSTRVVTSAEPSPAASPSGPADTALCAALSTEHAVIYGYGIVSAHCQPEVNNLVSSALNQHRQRRDQVIAMLAGRSVSSSGSRRGLPTADAGQQRHRCGAAGRANGEGHRSGLARGHRAGSESPTTANSA